MGTEERKFTIFEMERKPQFPGKSFQIPGTMEAAGAVEIFSTSVEQKLNLPKWIHDIIKPIFEDLSRDELLSKRLYSEPS